MCGAIAQKTQKIAWTPARAYGIDFAILMTAADDKPADDRPADDRPADDRPAIRVRATWDEYFMDIARVVATRATCNRKHVGAVLVRDRSILATGYNGSIRGLPHCDELGHLMEEGHCVRTVHAEANAIAQAAKHGVRIDGATIYVTASPCWGCFRLIANSGVVRIVFGEFYRDPKIFEFSQALGIELVDLSSNRSTTTTPTRAT
jgi:dCMP deaminase